MLKNILIIWAKSNSQKFCSTELDLHKLHLEWAQKNFKFGRKGTFSDKQRRSNLNKTQLQRQTIQNVCNWNKFLYLIFYCFKSLALKKILQCNNRLIQEATQDQVTLTAFTSSNEPSRVTSPINMTALSGPEVPLKKVNGNRYKDSKNFKLSNDYHGNTRYYLL